MKWQFSVQIDARVRGFTLLVAEISQYLAEGGVMERLDSWNPRVS